MGTRLALKWTCVVAAACLTAALMSGCCAAALAPQQDGGPSGTGGALAQPNPGAPAEPTRNAVDDINAHTNSVEGEQPGSAQEP